MTRRAAGEHARANLATQKTDKQALTYRPVDAQATRLLCSRHLHYSCGDTRHAPGCPRLSTHGGNSPGLLAGAPRLGIRAYEIAPHRPTQHQIAPHNIGIFTSLSTSSTSANCSPLPKIKCFYVLNVSKNFRMQFVLRPCFCAIRPRLIRQPGAAAGMSRCNGAVHNRNAASAAASDLARTAALLDVASCLAVLGPVLTDRASFRRLFAERASFRRRVTYIIKTSATSTSSSTLTSATSTGQGAQHTGTGSRAGDRSARTQRPPTRATTPAGSKSLCRSAGGWRTHGRARPLGPAPLTSATSTPVPCGDEHTRASAPAPSARAPASAACCHACPRSRMSG